MLAGWRCSRPWWPALAPPRRRRGRARPGRDPGARRAARPWPGGWARRRSRRLSSAGGRTAWARRATPRAHPTASCPGRRYAYAIRAGERIVARGSLRAAPLPAGRFRAAVFGDYGTVRDAQRASCGWRRAGGPTCCVLPGDQVYPLTLDLLLEPNLFRPLRPLLRRPPSLPALGNHEQIAAPAAALSSAPRAARRGALVPGALRLGGVPGARLEHLAGPRQRAGPLPRARRAAAERLLFRFAVLHHPPFAPHSERHRPAACARDLLPVLRRHGFQVLLLGHVHAYERSGRSTA